MDNANRMPSDIWSMLSFSTFPSGSQTNRAERVPLQSLGLGLRKGQLQGASKVRSPTQSGLVARRYVACSSSGVSNKGWLCSSWTYLLAMQHAQRTYDLVDSIVPQVYRVAVAEMPSHGAPWRQSPLSAVTSLHLGCPIEFLHRHTKS